MKLFVVIEGQGQYSDRNEYPIAAFSTLELANQFVDCLPQHRRQRFERYINGSDEERAAIAAECGLRPEHEEVWCSLITPFRSRTGTRAEYAKLFIGDWDEYDYAIAEIVLFDDPNQAIMAIARGDTP